MRRSFKGSLESGSIGTIHVDIKVRLQVESVGDHNYFVTIVEARTRHVVVCCVNDKAAIASELVKYVRFFESQRGFPIRKIHTDGGTKFLRALSKL